MYNTEREKWWIPFQSLWLLEDEDWMKERQKLWKNIRKNINDSGGLPALELNGLRNIFTTGYQYKEAPPVLDLDGIAKSMYVRPQQRLVLAPFTCEFDYRQFVYALPGQEEEKDRNLAKIMDSFGYLTSYFKGMAVLETKADEIYRHVLGGGTIYDNTHLLENEQALRYYQLPYRLNDYFLRIAILLQLPGYEDFPERPEYLIHEQLFDYYTSFAEFINENPTLFHDANFNFRSVSFRHFKNPCPLKDDRSQALYNKSRKFIFGGRLPKVMRIE